MKTKFYFSAMLAITLAACTTNKEVRQFNKGKLPEGSVLTDTIRVEAHKPENVVYQASYPIENDIINTSLKVSFSLEKQYLYGIEEITLAPHFYPTSHLTLDAKGMDIDTLFLISPVTKKLSFEYDQKQLNITLDKTYKRGEQYSVYIKYTAKPNELLDVIGSKAITDDRGLYFIDPLGTNPDKPTQIWTQGEPEANSCWFPTIDKPNMKSTQDLCITVDDKFTTVSNGIKYQATQNHDGTRTDCYKMTQKHAPYLFMMAIGEFEKFDTTWRGKTVDYYMEPGYGQYANDVFGRTPEMLEFYSNLLGVEYVWPKYSQVVVRDYVSGAMENTSSSLFYEALNADRNQLADRDYDDIIAHELFHQWFGDLVTCESWANLPLNESFATYGEYLWFEHKTGKEDADYHLFNDHTTYLNEAKNKQVDLIRFDYDEPGDMFDAHSYSKGGSILHMLRQIVGDDAFFASLNAYLLDNAYTSVEIHNLRLAVEKVTGQDMNWFFNQWFLSKGHPVLDYRSVYQNDSLYVSVKQHSSTGEKFSYRLPISTDVYTANGIEHFDMWLEKAEQTYAFPLKEKPLLVNYEASKTLLCEKTEDKNKAAYIYQLQNAPLFMDKYEAVAYLINNYYGDKEAEAALKQEMDKLHWYLKKAILDEVSFDLANPDELKKIEQLAQKEPNTAVRKAAINILSKTKEKTYMPVYDNAVNDPSYLVRAAGMRAIADCDPSRGLQLADQSNEIKTNEILAAVAYIYSAYGNEQNQAFFAENIPQVDDAKKYTLVFYYSYLLAKLDNYNAIDKGLNTMQDAYNNSKAFWMGSAVKSSLNRIKNSFADRKTSAEEKLKEDKSSSSDLKNEINLSDKVMEKVDEILDSLTKKS